MPAKDRSDPVAQTIAAESVAIAVARVLVSKMSDEEKKAFSADVTSIADAICAEVKAQAPAIGRPRGVSTEAANATAALITQRAQDVVKAHLAELIDGK